MQYMKIQITLIHKSNFQATDLFVNPVKMVTRHRLVLTFKHYRPAQKEKTVLEWVCNLFSSSCANNNKKQLRQNPQHNFSFTDVMEMEK